MSIEHRKVEQAKQLPLEGFSARAPSIPARMRLIAIGMIVVDAFKSFGEGGIRVLVMDAVKDEVRIIRDPVEVYLTRKGLKA